MAPPSYRCLSVPTVGFWKGIQMIQRTDQTIVLCIPEWICDWGIQEKPKYQYFSPNFLIADWPTEFDIVNCEAIGAA
jgi:hypothetical protein